MKPMERVLVPCDQPLCEVTLVSYCLSTANPYVGVGFNTSEKALEGQVCLGKAWWNYSTALKKSSCLYLYSCTQELDQTRW